MAEPQDSLSAEYLATRTDIERAEFDAWMERDIPRPPPKPKEPRTEEDIGLLREFGRGLARGTFQIGAAVGTSLEAAGIVFGSEQAKEMGAIAAEFWSQQSEEFRASSAAEGNLWDDPSLILSPNWMTANVAQTIPSLAAALIPAAGAYGVGIRVGTKILPYSPAIILKLARVGASITGGAIGGLLEGSSTFQEVKSRNGSDADAVKAMALMALTAAGLNAFSLLTILGPGKTAATRFVKGGLAESFTEWLEEPGEALILGDSVIEAMKVGLNVVAPTFFLGGGGAAVLGGKTSLEQAEETFGKAVTEAAETGEPIDPVVIEQALEAFEQAKTAETQRQVRRKEAPPRPPGPDIGIFRVPSQTVLRLQKLQPGERTNLIAMLREGAAEGESTQAFHERVGREFEIPAEVVPQLLPPDVDALPKLVGKTEGQKRTILAEEMAVSVANTLEELSQRTGKLIPTEEGGKGFRAIKGFKKQMESLFPELKGLKVGKKPANPADIVKAIREDAEKPLFLEIVARLKQGITDDDVLFFSEAAQQPGPEGFEAFSQAIDELAVAEGITPPVERRAEPRERFAEAQAGQELGAQMSRRQFLKSLVAAAATPKALQAAAIEELGGGVRVSENLLKDPRFAEILAAPPPVLPTGKVDRLVSLERQIEATEKETGTPDRALRNEAAILREEIGVQAVREPAEAGPPTAPPSPPAPPGAPPPGPPGELPGVPPPLPRKGESRINLRRVDATAAVKNILLNINRLNAEAQAEGRRTKKRTETIEEASQITVEQSLALDDEFASAPPATLAIRDHRDAAATHLDTLIDLTIAGDLEAAQDINPAYVLTGTLELKRETMVRNIARGLDIQNTPSVGARSTLNVQTIAARLDASRGLSDIDPLTLAHRLKTLRTIEQKVGWAKQVMQGVNKGRNMLYEVWINMLLSGPQTHAVNFLSNTLLVAWAPTERFIAQNLSWVTGNAQGVARGEAGALVRGIMSGWRDGLVQAKEIGIAGFDPVSKIELREPQITAGAFGAEGTSVGRAIDVIANLIRIPTRFLVTSDAFFKGINYRMEVNALSLRQATQEGLEGDALVERVAFLEQNPDPDIKDAAQQFALIQTFQNELGQIGQTFTEWTDLMPVARVVVPFIRTPTNIFKFAAQRTPGLNLLSAQNFSDITAGGARRDLALAKVAVSIMIGAVVGEMVAAGLITGAGPSDPKLRKLKEDLTNWQPFSIYILGKPVSYNRIDPAGAILGMIATYAELTGQLEEFDALQYATVVLLVLSEAALSKTYLQGMARMFDAIKRPDRSAKNLANSFSRSLIPAFARQFTRAADRRIREVENWRDALCSGLPWCNPDLPPDRNLKGDIRAYGPGYGPFMTDVGGFFGFLRDFVSPIYTGLPKSKEDEFIGDELARIFSSGEFAPPSMPAKVIQGTAPQQIPLRDPRFSEGIELNPEEYDLYVRLAGNELKDGRGFGMWDTLGREMRTERYKVENNRITDTERAIVLNRIILRFRESARAELIRRTERLQTLIKDRNERRMQMLRPQREVTPSSTKNLFDLGFR